tara:strand:- start:283 stop:699 length:417 start_codon:yes stop_codon:yes gene_type:complete
MINDLKILLYNLISNNMSDFISDEKTEEQYCREIEIIDQLFPNAEFTIAINIEELDDILSDKSSIVIKNTYTCRCYDNCKKEPDYFHITRKIGEQMTQKYIILELIKQGLKRECDHHFLEGFDKTTTSECQFELSFGS